MIPTYDEADNVTLLLRRLTESYPDPNVTFLVVDDESPDNTHDPADAGRLLARVASDADVAIGSRYVAGGSTPGRGSWRSPFTSATASGG